MSDFQLYTALWDVTDDDWRTAQDAYWVRHDRAALEALAARYGVETQAVTE